MSTCTEIAVFTVAKENINRITELSLSIFKEMNDNETVISAYEILRNTDCDTQLCWQLSWVSQKAAKDTTAKWPSFPSTKEFQSLVEKNVFYGHFVGMI